MMAAGRLLPSLDQTADPGFTGVVRKGMLQKFLFSLQPVFSSFLSQPAKIWC